MSRDPETVAREWLANEFDNLRLEDSVDSLAALLESHAAAARREVEAVKQSRDKLAWVLGGFKAWWQEVLARRLNSGPLDFAPEIANDTIKRIDLALDETNTTEFHREVDDLRERAERAEAERDASRERVTKLEGALQGISGFATAHHAEQPGHVLLHALTVDIPEAISRALSGGEGG